MQRFLALLFLLYSLSAFAAPVTLTKQEWTSLQSGEAMVKAPTLAATVAAFEREADGVVVVRHSADEAGQIWADDLRSWLVALGIPSASIRLESRVELTDTLILDITTRDKL